MANEYSDTDSEQLAIALFDDLTDGLATNIPEINWSDPLFNIGDGTDSPFYSEVKRVILDEITDTDINGKGAFDTLMRAYSNHLAKEYEAGRITGTEYTNIYLSTIQTAMSQALQFTLAKDQAYWQSTMAQLQARTAEIATVQARVQLATLKVNHGITLAQLDQSKAQYAVTKMQLAIEDVRYDLMKTQDAIEEYKLAQIMPVELAGLSLRNTGMGIQNETGIVQRETAEYNLEFMLPVQLTNLGKQTEVLDQQIAKSEKEVEHLEYQLSDMLPTQKDLLLSQVDNTREQTNKITADRNHVIYQTTFMLPAQRLNVEADTNVKTYTGNELLPAQFANTTADTLIKTYTRESLLPSQKRLTDEQGESKRAETMNVRSDGATVAGSVGKQKDLYDQQIVSYQRDAEVKAAKMWMDNWISHQTIFESDDTPTALGRTSFNDVMSSIKIRNNL